MKGRPKGSVIRNRICQILKKRGFSYGYEIFNLYKKFFGQVSMKSIYYNLKQGVKTGEVHLAKVKKEIGNYTWGDQTERVYYTLGPFSVLASEELPDMPKRNMECDWSSLMESELKALEKTITKKMPTHKKEKTLNRVQTLIEFGKFKKLDRDYISLLKIMEKKLCDPHTP